MTQFTKKLSHFDQKGWVKFYFHQWQLFRSKWLKFLYWCTERKIESFWPKKLCQILVPPLTQVLGSKWLNFFSLCTERKIESFWPKKLGWILIPPMTQLFKSKWLNFFSRCTKRKIESFWPKMLSHLRSWVETKTFKLKKHLLYLLDTQRIMGSLVLLLKLLISKIHQHYCYINYILKWFWKWFSNHLNFDVILIFKSPLLKWSGFWF